MNKVLFYLKPGFRIGNYLVKKRIDSGWTAEAYLVEEVPTMAEQVLKLYELYGDRQQVKNLRDFEHYCWFVEQLSEFALLPRYYHMGHVFLKAGDGIGTYYMVQEYLRGKPFLVCDCTKEMVDVLRGKVAQIHKKRGFALGDWEPKNLLISKKSIRMVDCDYGQHDKPNKNFAADLKALDKLFPKK
ncbi:MAG: hypothetical protein AB7V26_07095 [Lysobacterales bacterium]